MTILPQLEHDLGRAADERLRDTGTPVRQRVRSRVRVTAVRLPVALSVLVALGIAVIAISSLRHGHDAIPSARGGSGSSPRREHTYSPRAELVGTIAALRHPQSPADRSTELDQMALRTGPPAAYVRTHAQARERLAREGYPKPDQALFRTISVPSLHALVLIAPTTYQPSTTSPRRTEGINLLVASPGNDGAGTGPRPSTVRSFLAHGINIFFGMSARSNPGVMLVPDGVARVTLGPARPQRFQTPYHVSAKAVSRATATVDASAVVHDNIAAFDLEVPRIVSPKAYSFTPAIAATSPMTWYAADGRVIRRTTAQIYVLVDIVGGPSLAALRCRHLPHPRARICHG